MSIPSGRTEIRRTAIHSWVPPPGVPPPTTGRPEVDDTTTNQDKEDTKPWLNAELDAYYNDNPVPSEFEWDEAERDLVRWGFLKSVLSSSPSKTVGAGAFKRVEGSANLRGQPSQPNPPSEEVQAGMVGQFASDIQLHRLYPRLVYAYCKLTKVRLNFVVKQESSSVALMQGG